MDEEMELQVCQMWFNIVVAAAPGEGEITMRTADRQRDFWPHGAGITVYSAEQSCMDPSEGGMDLLINTHINLPTVCMCWDKCGVLVCLFMDVKSSFN